MKSLWYFGWLSRGEFLIGFSLSKVPWAWTFNLFLGFWRIAYRREQE